ncbi:MAG: hypothetical protein HY231_06510 [Acidobacteria bacterium]|nr:hypothetical protein [Acidobacteriota bacterium]
MSTNSATSTLKLIFIPAVITLAITLLRLVGELQHWAPALFSREAGGGAAIIGISWLPPLLGIYYARKLLHNDEAPVSAGRVILFAILGFVLMGLGGFVGFAPEVQFPGKIIVGLLLMTASGVVQFLPWRKLANVLLAYALAARIPVIIVMFLAIKGNWQTHYDVAQSGFPAMDWFSKFIQIGFLPQVFLWIPFTLITGALTAGITAAIMQRGKAIRTATV